MDCRVVVEAAVPVYDVTNTDEAIRIAISKTGEMLNPDLNYVEIDMADRHCSECGASVDPAFVAADEALVALHLEMTVFNVEGEQHASRITRKEIGRRLENIPLEVVTVETVEETGESDEVDDAEERPAGAAPDERGGTEESVEQVDPADEPHE
jgi:uncharacterized protein (UPF0212 family)